MSSPLSETNTHTHTKRTEVLRATTMYTLKKKKAKKKLNVSGRQKVGRVVLSKDCITRQSLV